MCCPCLVWICTSAQGTTKVIVIDANQPGIILENLFVCNSHVICIASVPGQETEEDGVCVCVCVCVCVDRFSTALQIQWNIDASKRLCSLL